MSSNEMDRRRLLAGAAGAASLAAFDKANAQDGKVSLLEVIDFHNHYIGPSFKITAPAENPAQQMLNRNLSSASALIESVDLAGIKSRVVNTPTAFLEDADGNVSASLYPRINDELANLVAKNSGKIYALASIDAWSGDSGAREVTRAVKELGLRGIYIESARGEALLNTAASRPILAKAAELGVPVFIHPQTDKQMHERFARTGALGARYARGTINSLALVSLLEGGVFDELPKLKVVVTTLAMGGIMMAGGFGNGFNIRKDAPDLVRRHVYVDTMGLNGPQVAAAVAMLGVDHVMAGTDWPIVVEKNVPERLRAAMISANLSVQDQEAIAYRNLQKLLGIV